MFQFKSKINKNEKIIAIAIALLLWQAIAMLINNNILLVGPIAVIKRLFQLIFEMEFWQACSFSFIRITAGWILALAIATLLSVLANKWQILDSLLWPYIVAMKATPVASFIILCLIWLSNNTLSILTVFLIVFPIVYSNMFEALKTVDKKMLEMANIFKMSLARQIRCIYIPYIMPFAKSTVKISIGMAWKAGVAAELIGLPKGSMGNFLYEAKLYLSTADLFAWTIVIIAISMLLEKAFLLAMDLFYKSLIKFRSKP